MLKIAKLKAALLVALLAALVGNCGAQMARATTWDSNWNDIALRRGDNDAVSRFRTVTLQYLLRAQGFKVAVDGSFRAQTESAVQQAQRRAGLKASGIVHNSTWAVLTPQLTRGAQGHAVRALQSAINHWIREHGAPSDRPLRVDGDFGAATERWVKTVQYSPDHEKTGIADAETWFTLLFDEH